MVDYAARLATFTRNLEQKADLAFIPVSADLHYLTGIPRDVPSFGWTIHPGEWLEGLWLAPGHDPVLTLPRMSAEFGALGSDAFQVRVLGDHDDPDTLIFDVLKSFELTRVPTVAVGDRAYSETIVHLQALLPTARFISATDLVREQRMIKDADDIVRMRQAGAITEAAFADTLTALKHGMTELELISELNYQLRRHGSLGESFPTALYNSGPNHPLLFGRRLESGPRVLQAPVSILFDFGAIYEGLCYDYGRTAFFGEPTEEVLKIHQLVMESQRAGIAALRPGNTTAKADAAARAVIADAGYGPAFRHRLGHGIGMDVHEPPFLTSSDQTPLQPGMVFTVEPSILHDTGVSARVEDVVLVTESGGEPLTKGWQDLIVVE